MNDPIQFDMASQPHVNKNGDVVLYQGANYDEQGQIVPGSEAGNLICETSMRGDIKNIVEIGTWNGLGSTACVLSALKRRGYDAAFTTIELYPDQYRKAVANIGVLPNVTVLNGTIVSLDDMAWLSGLTVERESLHAKLYFDSDMELLRTQQNVLDQLPRNIDFLILDGGEYSTYPEWVKLKDRTRIVFLDDTHTLKTKRIRAELLRDSGWVCVKDDRHSRNGFALFERCR